MLDRCNGKIHVENHRYELTRITKAMRPSDWRALFLFSRLFSETQRNHGDWNQRVVSTDTILQSGAQKITRISLSRSVRGVGSWQYRGKLDWCRILLSFTELLVLLLSLGPIQTVVCLCPKQKLYSLGNSAQIRWTSSLHCVLIIVC